MTVFLVTCDTAGAHESDDIMSVWTSQIKADTEAARLQELKEKGDGSVESTYGGDFHVKPVKLDQSSTQPIN